MPAHAPPPPLPPRQLRDRLAEERRRLLAAVAGLTEAETRQPLAPGAWSVHDLLAHRLYWEREEVQALGDHLLGRRAALLDFPLRNLDAVNAAAVRRLQNLATATILRQLRQTRALLDRLVVRVPDGELNTAENPARMLLGIALEHDREHSAQIRAWRRPERPSRPPARGTP